MDGCLLVNTFIACSVYLLSIVPRPPPARHPPSRAARRPNGDTVTYGAHVGSHGQRGFGPRPWLEIFFFGTGTRERSWKTLPGQITVS